MSYIINKFNGEQLIVLQDGTIDTTTSLNLVGRNYVGYGEAQNENFVFMLENFANPSPPSRPLQGQIWFSTADNSANVYDGTAWGPIGNATLSPTAPITANNGTLWLDTNADQLKIYTGTDWELVGPEAVAEFGTTRARSISVDDSLGNPKPIIIIETDGVPMAICSSEAFTINTGFSITGFSNGLISGINLSNTSKINGSITGNAPTADKLLTARSINGVPFDGTSNITLSASTTNPLVSGTYILGNDFNGSVATTWSVDATSSNVIGKVVARNSVGGFSAGQITASFVGELTGNVTATSGYSSFNEVRATTFVGATLTGTANAANQLANTRKINGVNFNGTSDITITSAAATLTGNTLAPTVALSSLTSVGTLTALAVADAGIDVGSASQLKMFVDASTPTIRSATGTLNFDMGSTGPDVSFVNATRSLSLGGPNAPAIIGDNTTNLGIAGYKFNNVYANNFVGNADTATLATSSNNLVGGGSGALPYQSAIGTTSMLGLGADGYVLRARTAGPTWEALSYEQLNKGSYVNMINTSTTGNVSSYSSSIPVTISVDATSANTVSKVVARDSSGNFAAGTITANLVGAVTGAVTGNASTASSLQTARTINGVSFNGTTNITVPALDASKVPLAGGSMSGYLTLVGSPVSTNHAATKSYVDTQVAGVTNFTAISGNTIYSTSGFTNQVGSFNNGANFFDVFPPSGKTMSNLVAFVPSIAVIHFAGGVNADDSMRCTWSNLGDRIRVYVQNTEQRSTPAANYMAIWS
jgi:hypothetical protein